MPGRDYRAEFFAVVAAYTNVVILQAWGMLNLKIFDIVWFVLRQQVLHPPFFPILLSIFRLLNSEYSVNILMFFGMGSVLRIRPSPSPSRSPAALAPSSVITAAIHIVLTLIYGGIHDHTRAYLTICRYQLDDTATVAAGYVDACRPVPASLRGQRRKPSVGFAAPVSVERGENGMDVAPPDGIAPAEYSNAHLQTTVNRRSPLPIDVHRRYPAFTRYALSFILVSAFAEDVPCSRSPTIIVLFGDAGDIYPTVKANYAADTAYGYRHRGKLAARQVARHRNG